MGQCGNQIGSQLWPLILQEYGIQDVPGGIVRQMTNYNDVKGNNNFDSLHSFFSGCEDLGDSNIPKAFSDIKKCNLKARVKKTKTIRSKSFTFDVILGCLGRYGRFGGGSFSHGPYETSVRQKMHSQELPRFGK